MTPKWSPTFRKCYLGKSLHDESTLTLLLTNHAHELDSVGKVGTAGLVMEALACVKALSNLRQDVRDVLSDSAKYPQLKMPEHQEKRLDRALIQSHL